MKIALNINLPFELLAAVSTTCRSLKIPQSLLAEKLVRFSDLDAEVILMTLTFLGWATSICVFFMKIY
jgi:hypothetical protein